MINHLACIMDGNRRWAKKAGCLLNRGVKEGMNNINTVVNFCLKHNIPFLSLYAFSIENLKRSAFERDCCFSLILENGENQAKDMKQKGVRVRFVGDHSLFPSSVRDMINYVEQETATGTQLTLNLLFCYGGKQEIIAGIRSIIKKVRADNWSDTDLDEESFKNYLWTGAIPDPDLIIRTGFAQRLSNFLPYQSAYSELYFANCLWPDLTEKELEEAVQYLTECKRNFGK
jgi:undecaprenyl diphosphate synthase